LIISKCYLCGNVANIYTLKTIKFHRTECGVDFLLNVLMSKDVKANYLDGEPFNSDYFEAVFIKKAKGSIILNHSQINLLDNMILFISPYQKRQWFFEEHHVEFTTLIFQEEFLNEFFADKLFTYRLLYFYQLDYPLIMPVSNSMIERFCDLLTEIKSELTATKADSVHIIRSLLYYLLQSLNREYALQNRLLMEKANDNYAYQFRKLLEVNIRYKQRINDYTEMLNVSRITLNKAVRKQFNVTAIELLKQRLLFEIKNDLIYSGKSISEIAYGLQFPEPGHMMRFFKTLTGITTGQFILDYQNGIPS
jgi:AraC family transcriptional activator of pobA